jgi:MFS transporter, DHA2 family, multidrug resistance protein
MTLGKEGATTLGVLRTMVLYQRDRTKVVLQGQLIGEWADYLPEAIGRCCSARDAVEIDLDGVTCADRAGEQALLSLWRAHRHLVCTSPFAQALCQSLGIPVEGGQSMTIAPPRQQGNPSAVVRHIASLADGPWLITAAVMLATFMEILDGTVVNVSLTHIAGSLSATPNEATWALTSYLVANGIVIPISGWLANRIGRRNLLLVSTGGFTVASLLCGIAPSLGLLVAFRVIQGACGGSMQPLSQAVMLEVFPPKQHGKAMAIWGVGALVAPVLGPVLGGWLTDNFSWRWIFYINLPVGLISLVMINAFLKDPPYIRRSSARVDTWGLATLVIWVVALQIMLDKGQEDDWFDSRFIVFLAVAFVVGIVAWVAGELTTRDPVADLRVFRQVPFAAGTVVMALQGFVIYGSQVTISIWLQTLMGYPSVQAGVAMVAMGMGAALAMPLASALVSRFDPRKVLVCGVLGFAFSFYRLMGFNLNIGFWDVFWPQLIQGLALGLVFVPLTVVTMAFIPKEKMGNATSLFNMMRNIGGGVGISVVETMLTRMGQEHTNFLVANVTPTSAPALRLFGGLRGLFGGSGPMFADQQAYAALFGLVQREATMLALIRVFQYLGVLVLVLIPIIALTKRPPKGQSSQPVGH